MAESLITTPILVIDIGADGGVFELPGLASQCDVHAFDARTDSCNTIEEESRTSAYRSLRVHNHAVAGRSGPRRLYVTKQPQASSLLEPDPDIIRRVWREGDGFTIVAETDIDCITLSAFCTREGIERIDHIKIDTQGTELEILEGAAEILPRISVISAEVEFVPLYRGQPLFDDLVRYLRAHGFRFVGFKELITDDRKPDGKKIWGEAVFTATTFNPRSETAMKAGLILMDLGFTADGKWLLADCGFEEEIIGKAARDQAARSGSGLQRLGLKLIDRAQAMNERRRRAGKKPIDFGPFKSLLTRFSWGQRLLGIVSRVRAD
ncbi:MAG: FkbM family methyltransferase [Rhodospirillales bacterium]